MRILDRINDTRAARGHPAGGAIIPDSFVDRWGYQDDRFGPPEYAAYLATSADVYSCAQLRARRMTSVPIRGYAGSGPDRTEQTDDPAVQLLRYVNPFWTWPRLSRMDELSMSIWGETFWAIEKTAGGRPAEIWWMKADRVKPVLDDERYIIGFAYEPIRGGPPVPFLAEEVVWQRYPNPLDEFSPLSPIAAARLAADAGRAMMRSNERMFINGLQAAAIVTPPKNVTFSPEDAQRLEDQLEKRLAGVDKAHRWAVLRFEAQVSDAGVTPRDAQFVEGLNVTLRQVCNAYGIPSPLLNDLEHATLSNVDVYDRQLWEGALVPDLALRDAELEEQLLPMFGSRTEVTAFGRDYSKVPALQKANSETWDRERGQIEVGALTINEWRKAHGLPSVPWGDTWWRPVNKADVDDNGEVVTGAVAPAS